MLFFGLFELDDQVLDLASLVVLPVGEGTSLSAHPLDGLDLLPLEVKAVPPQYLLGLVKLGFRLNLLEVRVKVVIQLRQGLERGHFLFELEYYVRGLSPGIALFPGVVLSRRVIDLASVKLLVSLGVLGGGCTVVNEELRRIKRLPVVGGHRGQFIVEDALIHSEALIKLCFI